MPADASKPRDEGAQAERSLMDRRVEAAAEAFWARNGFVNNPTPWNKLPSELRNEVRRSMRPAIKAADDVASEATQ